MRDQKIIEYVSAVGWALQVTVLEQLSRILGRHAAGIRVPDEELAEVRVIRAERHGPGADGADMDIIGGVAVLPIKGVIAKHARQVNGVSQPRGTSGDTIRNWVRQAAASPSVHTILLDIDSPGGIVDGITETAAEIRAAREHKRVLAHADGAMASAAYWLGSQAEKIYTTKTAAVGSIGVYQLVVDDSAAMESRGYRFHVIKSGEHKAVGEIGQVVTAEQLAVIQESIDHLYGLFVDDVTAGRGMDRATVEGLADGRWWIGSAAMANGLADEIATHEELLADLNANPPQSAAAQIFRVSEPKPSAATAAAQPERIEDMTQPQAAATPADIEKANPDAVAQIRDAAVAGERARITAIRGAALDFQAELAEQLIVDGKTVEEATAALHADLRDKYQQQRRADAVTSSKPVGGAPSRADGAADQDEQVWDEAQGKLVKPGTEGEDDEVFDYEACGSEDEVAEMAEREWATLSKDEQKLFGSVTGFRAMRKGEHRQRQVWKRAGTGS